MAYLEFNSGHGLDFFDVGLTQGFAVINLLKQKQNGGHRAGSNLCEYDLCNFWG